MVYQARHLYRERSGCLAPRRVPCVVDNSSVGDELARMHRQLMENAELLPRQLD